MDGRTPQIVQPNCDFSFFNDPYLSPQTARETQEHKVLESAVGGHSGLGLGKGAFVGREVPTKLKKGNRENHKYQENYK